MSKVKRRIHIGEPSAGLKSFRPDGAMIDYLKRDRETLEEGIYYEDCQSAADNWDDNWSRCPICLEYMYIETDEDGNEKKILEHALSMARFHQ
jgi:hypothetical protein